MLLKLINHLSSDRRLAVYLWLYRWTNNRVWVSRYISEMQRQIEEDIKQWRLSHETN